ncbi:unnamed protein product [Pedinophyceae sp. YPF-701]|nr:unnamed protein product [Pedinophyceae sp. YPF-701]
MMRRRRRGDTGAPAPSKRARVDTSTRPELEDSQYGRAGSVNLSDAGSGGSTSPTSALVRPYRGGTPGGTLEALKCGRDGPLANIIRRLPPRSRAALAATSSTLMASVLDSCPGARWCESEDVWVRTKGSRDAGAAETRQGSGRMVAWRLRGKVSEDGTSLIGWWLTDDRSWRAWCHAGREAVQGAVVEVEMRKERVPPEPVVTAEMTDLRRVIIRWCSWRSLAMHKVWGCGGPPPGVAAGIRELVLARTGVERVSVPKGMASLEVLDVSG